MPKPPPPDPGLIFDWRQPRTERTRLTLWLLVAFFGLAAFFALFRVVYPQTQRIVPVAQQVTLLGSDTATQSVLNTVQDHDFLIIPSADSKRNLVTLEDRAPVFHPSYEKHELKLLDLPQRNTKPAPVRLLDVREPVLPRLDLSELDRKPQTPAATKPAKLTLHLQGGLTSRAITSQPDFSVLQTLEPESWRFHLGVNGAGTVVFALPMETPSKPGDAAPLLRVLRQIRFAPDAAEKTTWGEAALVWSASTEP